MLLPLSYPMYDDEFDYDGGGGGSGGPAAAAVAAVEAVEDNLSAKAASNESVDGRMTACNDKIGQQTTTQQPVNQRMAARQQRQRRWRQRDLCTIAFHWRMLFSIILDNIVGFLLL